MRAVRLNAGGNDVAADSGGNFWARDNHFTGQTTTTANAITGAAAADLPIYQSCRYGGGPSDFRLNLFLPPGTYALTTKHTLFTNAREIDIQLNGTLLGHVSISTWAAVDFTATVTIPDVQNASTPNCQFLFHSTNGNEPLVCGVQMVPSTPPTYDTLIAAEANLHSWWKLAEASGTSAADSKSTDTAAMSAAGSMAFGQPGPWQDTALKFDGVNYLAVASIDAAFPIAAPYTIEAWFYIPPGTGVSTHDLISWGTAGTSNGMIGLMINGDQTISNFWWGNDLGVGGLNGGVTFADGLWHFAACSYDGTTRKIFFDGALVASASASGLAATRSGLNIGRRNNATMLVPSGLVLSEVAVYSAALLDVDITSAHYAGKNNAAALARTTQLVVEVLANNPAALARISQLVVEVLAGAVPNPPGGTVTYLWNADPPIPGRAWGNGDGTYSLGLTANKTHAAGDVIGRLYGDPPLPFLFKSAGGGLYDLATRPAAPRGVNDMICRLAGDPPLAFLAISNGDGTFSLATYSGAVSAADPVWRPAGSLTPMRAHANGDGTYSLIIAAWSTAGAGDVHVRLHGAQPPILAKNNGDNTYAFSAYSS